MLRGRWRLPGAGPELGSRGLAWILLLVLVTASKNQNNSKMQVFETLIKLNNLVCLYNEIYI